MGIGDDDGTDQSDEQQDASEPGGHQVIGIERFAQAGDVWLLNALRVLIHDVGR